MLSEPRSNFILSTVSGGPAKLADGPSSSQYPSQYIKSTPVFDIRSLAPTYLKGLTIGFEGQDRIISLHLIWPFGLSSETILVFLLIRFKLM